MNDSSNKMYKVDIEVWARVTNAALDRENFLQEIPLI